MAEPQLPNEQEDREFFDLFDTLVSPLRGIEGALQGVYNLADYVVDDALPDWDERFLGESKSTVGTLVEGVSQFATGFVPIFGLAGRAGTLAKAGSLTQRALQNNLTRGAGASVVSDFSVFNGQEERLSNFIQQFPELQNPVTEFLAHDEDEGEIEGRLKNVLEGLGLEAATLGLIKGLKAVKKGRKVRGEGGSPLDVYTAQEAELGEDYIANLPDFLDGAKRVPDAPEEFESIIEARPPRQPFKTNLEAKRGLEGSRGPDYLKGRLQKKFTIEGADPEDVKDIETFIDTIGESMFDDVSMSITNKIQARGRYNFGNNLLEIRKTAIEEGDLKRPMVHELWHSLSRYLPKKDVTALTGQFDKVRKGFLDDLSKRAKDTNLSAKERLALAKELNDFKKGDYTEANYRFSDIDEYFAEEMTDAFLSKLDADDALAAPGTFKRVAQEVAILMKAMFASMKSKLGIDQRQKIFNDFIKQRNVKIQRQKPLDFSNFKIAEMKDFDPSIKKAWSEAEVDPDTPRGRIINIGQLDSTDKIEQVRIAGREAVKNELPDPGAKSLDEQKQEAFEELANVSADIAKNWKGIQIDSLEKAKELRMEIMVMKDFGRSLAKRVLDIAKEYKDSKGSKVALAKLKNTFQELVEYEAYYSAIGREQALGLGARRERFANTRKIGVGETELNTSEGIRNKYINENGGLDEEKFIKLVNEASDDADLEKSLVSFLKLAKKTQGNKMLSMAREYWINAILSGPRTHVVNAVGNTLSSVLATIETAVGGALTGNMDVVKHAFSSWCSWEMVKESASFALKAAKTGDNQLLPDAKAFDDGRTDSITPEAFGLQQMQGPLREGEAFKGDKLYKFVDRMGEFARLPSRLLMTSDEFFKQINYRRAARFKLAIDGINSGISDPYSLAQHIEGGLENVVDSGGRYYSKDSHVRDATKLADEKGITDIAERTKFVSEYVDNNFNEDASALAEFAKNEAEYLTFTRELPEGTAGRVIQDAVRKWPVASFVLPFVRTPTNLLSFAFERNIPYQAGKALLLPSYRKEFLEALRSSDPIVRAQAQGKMATGAAIGGMMLDALCNNRETITGGGPKDEAQRKALEATGWRPYSFKIGDQYVSYQRLDPIGTLIGVGADFIESGVKHPSGFQATGFEKVSAAIMITIARNVTNKSYLSGMQLVLNALTNPERHAPRMMRNYISSALPMSGFINQIQAGGGDQEAREIRSIYDAVMNKLPMARSGLDPKRNLLGEEVTIENLPLIGALNPVAHSTVKDDQVMTELANLRHGFKSPPSTYNGVIDLLKFTNEKGQTAHDRRLERLKDVRIGGRTMRQELQRLINSRSYQRMSATSEPGFPSPRISMINRVLTKYRNKALDETMTEFPELDQYYNQVSNAKFQLRMGAESSDVLSLLNQ